MATRTNGRVKNQWHAEVAGVLPDSERRDIQIAQSADAI
jgi:hypothetical protein